MPVRLGKEVSNVKAREDIPFGFKIAVADTSKDAPVMKCGEEIGIASVDIREHEKARIHNMVGGRDRGHLGRASCPEPARVLE